MASFNTHLAVGITVSGIAAIAAMTFGLAEHSEVIPLFALCVIGSLLPDIDADASKPLQITLTLLAILLAFFFTFTAAAHFPTLGELLLIWFVSYLLIRWGVFYLFVCYTTHRGIIHSLPVALLVGIGSAAVGYWLLALPPFTAWLAGAFVSLGFITHLLLDELSALNLLGARTRRSLGSAMKLWYRASWRSSIAAYLLLVLLFPLAPPTAEPLQQLAALELGDQLWQQIWPNEGWYLFDWPLPLEAPAARRSLP